ncbi:MAG: beta-galactosidase [Planctomycetota bacterium]|nr:MAG: beta-galactosidase [Planctomycetota bacterium]
MPAQSYPALLNNHQGFLHGADYNPDQWLQHPHIIEEDFQIISRAGMNSWSLGIFSWAALEPEPGVYRFDWMQDILDRCAQANIAIILATPSGSKPAWLSQAHPEVCRVLQWQGPREPHRGRHNHCPSSEVYRREVSRINGELSRRFGAHPAVKLWHLSNEYGGECRCETCLQGFRRWLQERYGSLDALNDAYWNGFWGHPYNDWEQVHPFEVIHDGLQLDWRRFVTDITVDFMLMEKAAVRQHSDLPVTTNMMGHYPGLDYWRLAPHLDVISNDAYPSFDGRSDESTSLTQAICDANLMRSLGGGKPWLLMESTPSQLNWTENFVMKRPGVHRREMYLQIGAGADGTCYFQWRKGRGGSEKYHGAIIDHAGTHTRVMREVAEYGHTLPQLEAVLGSGVNARVGLIEDWQMRWGLECAHGPRKNPKHKGYMDEIHAWHHAAVSRGLSVDIVPSNGDLSNYDLLLMPMGYQVDEKLGQALERFVGNGGILITSYLSAHCDPHNRCHLGGWPGSGLRQLCGVWAEEMDGLPDGEVVQVTSETHLPGLAATGRARTYCERIHAEDAEVLARYRSEFYAGEPVLCRRAAGKGYAYYLAARMDQAFLDSLIDAVVEAHQVPSILPQRPPPGIIVQERDNGQQRFLFVHNATPTAREAPLPPGTWTDLTHGSTYRDSLSLSGVDSRVLIWQNISS